MTKDKHPRVAADYSIHWDLAASRDEQLIDLVLTLLIGFGTFLIVIAFLSR